MLKVLLLAALALVPALALSSGHGDEKALLRGIRRLAVSLKVAPELTAAGLSTGALRNVLETQLETSGVVTVAPPTEGSDASLVIFLNGTSVEPARGRPYWAVSVGVRLQQPVQLLRSGEVFRGGTWHRTTIFWIGPDEEKTLAIKQRVLYLIDVFLSDLAGANVTRAD